MPVANALWNRTKRPILRTLLVVSHYFFRGEGLRFEDRRINAGYATYRTVASLTVLPQSLFAVQVGQGVVPVMTTPTSPS